MITNETYAALAGHLLWLFPPLILYLVYLSFKALVEASKDHWWWR